MCSLSLSIPYSYSMRPALDLAAEGGKVKKEETLENAYSGKAGSLCTPELAPAHCKTNEIVIVVITSSRRSNCGAARKYPLFL